MGEISYKTFDHMHLHRRILKVNLAFDLAKNEIISLLFLSRPSIQTNQVIQATFVFKLSDNSFPIRILP